MLWKNGERVPLEGGEGTSDAKSVFVQGDDVYVLGHAPGPDRAYPDLVVWKNGARHLELKAHYNHGNDHCVDHDRYDHRVDYDAASLFVSGGDVYFAGKVVEYAEGTPDYDGSKYTETLRRYPAIWKNGEKTILLRDEDEYSKYGGSADAVLVWGDDVYVAVRTAGSVSLWKNGVPQWWRQPQK